MNLHDEVEKIKGEGYSEANAEAKLCQDIVLKAIAESGMGRNATIKGGVVMRSISKNARRATQDLDLDFIRYSISDPQSVNRIIKRITESYNNHEVLEAAREGSEPLLLPKFSCHHLRHNIYSRISAFIIPSG